MLSDPHDPNDAHGLGWFDAHLDLAYLAETGRDMHAEPDDCRGRYQPAAVTLPSLASGKVTACLGTIFTQAVPDPASPEAETGAFAYPIDDAEAARVCGVRQLKLYHAWRDAGLIQLLPTHGNPWPEQAAPLTLGVLMECADPIVSPDDLGEWVEGGVVAIGMSWVYQSRYAGGNATDTKQHRGGTGLTDLGRSLVAAMDEHRVLHDASHLSRRSLDDLFEVTDAMVVATHSNAASQLPNDYSIRARNLDDEAIAEIGRRGGVVGLNLFSLLVSGNDTGRATIDDAVRHVEHICEVMGHRRGIGLGSDMDGGFPADRLPTGIDQPSDLAKLSSALLERGWSAPEVAGFMRTNWQRVLSTR
ncbi:MAG: membrane dipeptidase [Planctomycetota bacterium]